MAATKVGGIPEVVIHQKTGLLVEPENDEALADAIIYLLTNQDESVAMGHSARCLALEQFNLEHSVDSYQALYEQLTQSKSA